MHKLKICLVILFLTRKKFHVKQTFVLSSSLKLGPGDKRWRLSADVYVKYRLVKWVPFLWVKLLNYRVYNRISAPTFVVKDKCFKIGLIYFMIAACLWSLSLMTSSCVMWYCFKDALFKAESLPNQKFD